MFVPMRKVLSKVVEGSSALLLVAVVPAAIWVFAGRPEPGEGFFNLVMIGEAAVVAAAIVLTRACREYLLQRRAGHPVRSSLIASMSVIVQAAFPKQEPKEEPKH